MEQDHRVIDRIFQSGLAVAKLIGVETDPHKVTELYGILRNLDIASTECRRCPYRVEVEGEVLAL